MSPAPAAFDARRLERLGIEPAWSRSLPVLLADGERVQVHALDASPPDGREPPLTVVCVHGNPTWSVMWRSFHQRLGDRYRVLAVDQVSMGLSERTGPRVYAQRVDDLGRILDAFDVDGPVVVAAHDWGGPIALGWALEHQRAGARDPARQHGRRDAARRACRCRSASRATSCCATSAAGGPRPFCGRRWRRRTAASARRRGARISRPYASSDDRQAIADFVADIPTTPAHPSYAPLAAVADRLSELKCRCCSPGASAIRSSTSPSPPTCAARLPQAELHRFPLAGHLVVEEEDVAALADTWIERLLEPPARRSRRGAARGAASGARSSPRSSRARPTTRRRSPSAVASSLSFAALADRVASIAEGLRAAGVAPGDRVALLAPDPPDFIAAAYACWAIGAVAVVVDRGLGFRGLRRALRSAEPRWLVGTRKTLGAARALRWAPDARPLELASLSGSGAKLSDVVERHAPGADALAAVVFTSGATGPAKGVLYDQRTMAAQYTAVRECYAIGADDRLVAAFAPFALYGPALGIPVAVPDCDITKPASLRAEALADACAAVEATIVFAAPAALDGVLASRETLTRGGEEGARRGSASSSLPAHPCRSARSRRSASSLRPPSSTRPTA